MFTRKCARVQVPENHFVKHQRKICLPLHLKTNASYQEVESFPQLSRTVEYQHAWELLKFDESKQILQ